jgi:TFIIF-interacting CTD phosphatase-like protein
MKRPEVEKVAKIVADLVRNYFRLLTVAVRETKRRLDDAQVASPTMIVADQKPTNRRSCYSTATREKKRTSLSRSSELESESVSREPGVCTAARKAVTMS